jgi:hypothetical protein
MEKAIPRDLEKLARSYQLIREIDPDFVGRVAGCLSEADFFTATHKDWHEQSTELQHIVLFFCFGENLEPGATWVRKNKQHIAGPLCTLFAAIAPDVAIEFHRSSSGIDIVNPKAARWQYTSLAVARLAALDKPLCGEVIGDQLGKLRDAMYSFQADSVGHILRFLRVLFSVSPDMFERFASSLDLDDPIARATIAGVVRNHPKEQLQFQKLARCGQRLTGRVAEICNELLRQLTEDPRS